MLALPNMKRAINNIIALIIFGIAVFICYFTYVNYGGRIKSMLFPYIPCSAPIVYSLGTFDTEFGISKQNFLNALSSASAIWEKSYGEDLFTYVPDDSGAGLDHLKVNLVYDYRQQATEKLHDLGGVVNDSQASYDSLRSKYLSLKSQNTALKTQYDVAIEEYEASKVEYEKDVAYWNKHGGAPKGEYAALEAERQTLNSQVDRIRSLQASLNAQVGEINAIVPMLNQLATSLNITVDKYNTVGASRGEEFEEGLYETDGYSARIDIYEFSSQNKLVRVLAHELGHALGLEHVDDPKAIMYKLNQGSTETLAAADVVELKRVCMVK